MKHCTIEDLEIVKKDDLTVRTKIQELEKRILAIPGAVYGDQPTCPLKHSFADGLYVREIFAPKGHLIVTKLFKQSHPTFLLKGKCSILTEQGIQKVEGPQYWITPIGTKRVIYIHEDVTWVTVHPTNTEDLLEIEKQVIALDYEEIDALNAKDVQMLMEG